MFKIIIIRELKIYDVTIPKTSLKISSSSLSLFLVIVKLVFGNVPNYPGTELRGSVSKLGKKIQIRAMQFLFIKYAEFVRVVAAAVSLILNGCD